ncbi:hypothetical protein CDAR_477821 [Caerostris darwini]|uniref:Uncharacterized protein n=1 Tax=Caerostris darwini TaxID=1538125 RepID=A0AAV4PYE2_9ARAC|nr:hypothetical protein CDAR_477821 [Caerostris darwini]
MVAILEHSSALQRHRISLEENPADILSRAVDPTRLIVMERPKLSSRKKCKDIDDTPFEASCHRRNASLLGNQLLRTWLGSRNMFL